MTRRPALMLQIATGDPRPINRQIGDGVRGMIASGELDVGAANVGVNGRGRPMAR